MFRASTQLRAVEVGGHAMRGSKKNAVVEDVGGSNA